MHSKERDVALSSITKRLTLITNGISFVITLAVFICVYLIKGMPLEVGIGIAIVVYSAVVSFILIDVRYQWHRAVLGPLRKYLRYMLASIVIEKWSEHIEIDHDGNGDIVHEIHGKANFGFNKWIMFGIVSDTDQPDKEAFPINITNLDDDSTVVPTFLFDYPRYKRVRIPFGYELDRGKKFNFRIEYSLAKTFRLGTTDYHSHHAFHYEKDIDMSVSFPKNCRVVDVTGDITSEHGDVRGKRNSPEKKTDNFVTWQVRRAMHGDDHKLSWSTVFR